MRAAEARALGALAGHVVAGTATRVEEVHQAVLARTPARRFGIARLHDAIAAPVYATVRGVSRVTAAGAGAALGAARPAAATPLADSRAGATALGALAGLCGDVVAREHAPLVQATGLRGGG